jgi:diguanylate cyclase (GGDEF)-like protein
VFSVLLCARIVRHPAASPRRRVVGAVHDNVVATLWLSTTGPAGALALFVYPFITVGNGFRFSVRYLAASGSLGAIGLGALVLAAPGWRSYGVIAVGVLLSHVCATVYAGVLLRSLYRTKEQLAKLATHDALTDLPNRRCFSDRLLQLVEGLTSDPLACLYLDLDGFKAANDPYGHTVGDELLKQVALARRGYIAPSGLVTRVGGDEAGWVAEQTIAAVEAITSVNGEPVDVSVSVGICFVPADTPTTRVHLDALLKAADDAMYLAKRSGRAAIAWWDWTASRSQPATQSPPFCGCRTTPGARAHHA